MDTTEILYKPGVTIDRFASGGGSEWNQLWGPECLYRDILPHLRSGSKVLDLGCGFGRCSLGFGYAGADVTGIDSSAENLSVCAERFAAAGIEVQLIRGDARRIPLDALGVFDVVVAVETFNHFTKTEAVSVVSTIPKILPRGGFGVVSFPSTLSWSYDRMRWWRERTEAYTYRDWCDCTGEMKLDNYAFFEPGEAESLFVRSGMSIVSAEKTWAPQWNYNWTVVARMD